jgi:hypothetical protein
VAINTKKYIESYLKIRTKSAEIKPLILNAPQQRLYDTIASQHRAGKPVRVIILKARQMGFSTLTEAIIFKATATARHVTSAIVAHDDKATQNLFEMSKRYYNYLPKPLQPQIKASNAYELVFDTKDGKGLDSKIKCFTAGGQSIGRSDTIHNLHISELAFWSGDKASTLLGLLQAVPDMPGTMIIIESTANGYDYYKELWDMAVAGESEYVPLFVAWWELDEYQRPYTGFELTADERRLKALYGLTNEQLEWRRWCIANQCGGNEERFKQEYPACPEEAFISTGNCYFGQDGKERIIERIQQLNSQVYRQGYFDYDYDGLKITNIRWVDDKRGEIKIYRDVEERHPYVIGGDTAGEGSDYFVGQVLDNSTGEQVAVLRKQYGEEQYARQMYCLGQYYNNALLGIEVNFSTYPVKELCRLEYPNQYLRQKEDIVRTEYEHKYGFKTTTSTRPAALGALATVVREEIDTINDIDTLREMLTFIKNDHGKPVAEQGKHDDLVMGLAIAHYIRPQQDYRVKEIKEEPRKKLIQTLLKKAKRIC